MITDQVDIYKNKMRLHTLNTGRFKMSRLSLNFVFPKDEYRTPLTKLMLSVLMRGSSKYPTVTAINKALDERYGAAVSLRSISVGDKCIFKISCKLISEKFAFCTDETDILGDVLHIVSDIIFNPLLDENGMLRADYIESEKKIAIDALAAKVNDPKSYASEQCSKYLLKGSPSAISIDGDEEQIKSFNAKELTENLDWFYKNCVLECYYIGDEDASRVASLLKKNFKLDAESANTLGYRENAIKNPENKVKNIEESLNVSQGRLVIGYRCGTVMSDSDSHAMSLFNEMFGGSSVSKLFLNVREKKSLCYYCYSSYHSATGTIKVGCGINPRNKEPAVLEIEKQLDAMRRGEFTDTEINTAKRTLISGIKQMSDSSASIEAFVFRRLLAGVSETGEEYIEKISQVTREELMTAANKVKLDTLYFLSGDGGEEREDE